jgi:uncharacterized protein (TIGR00255 family)
MTLASMTGFGRAQGELSPRLAASVVVRSVNHKFLEVVVRVNVREEVPELEAAVRAAVVDRLERGRVTVQIYLERTGPAPIKISVNAEAVASAAQQLDQLELPESVVGSVELGHLLMVPGIVTSESVVSQPDPEELAALREVATAAVFELVEIREVEGARLHVQVGRDVDQIEAFLDWFEPQADGFRRAIHERLRDRLTELLEPVGAVDSERLLQEAAILADRADVSEETVRLRSHLRGFRDRMSGSGPVGRALDFMCQEILRELNTLGSKCREIGVADRLVDAKGALERVREQVQNIE